MNPTKTVLLPLLLVLPLLFSGCSEEPSVQKYKVSKTPMPNAGNSTGGSSGSSVQLDGQPFSWTVPDGWEAGKESSMRLASYNVPLSGGEVGDFSLVKLGGAAGGVLANLNRWRGQIGLEDATMEQVAEFAAHRSF